LIFVAGTSHKAKCNAPHVAVAHRSGMLHFHTAQYASLLAPYPVRLAALTMKAAAHHKNSIVFGQANEAMFPGDPP